MESKHLCRFKPAKDTQKVCVPFQGDVCHVAQGRAVLFWMAWSLTKQAPDLIVAARGELMWLIHGSHASSVFQT